MQEQILDSAYKFMKEVESGERIIVGVNKFQVDEPTNMKAMTFDETVESRQLERLKKVRREREESNVERTLKELKEAAVEGVNLVPYCSAAVKSYATVGEMCHVLRDVWGEYEPKGL
jgi:methylmalonyl-CoA mutase N-terminal domain/subunit